MQLDLGTQGIVAGALYDFLGHLTTLDQNMVVGATADCVPALDELVRWAHLRGLPLDSQYLDVRVEDWDKAPEKPTLQMLASTGMDQQKTVMAALVDFADFADSQTVSLNHRRDWEGTFKRWATRKALTISNPQLHWNFRQWL